MRSRPIVVRLENWGKCLRMYVPGWTAPTPMGGELCSAESQWRSGFRSIVADVTYTLDVHDAKVIESAVGSLKLYPHTLLKAWYVRSYSPGKCLAYAARAAGIPRARFPAFDDLLEDAHDQVLDELAIPAVVRKVRAHQIVRQTLALGMA